MLSTGTLTMLIALALLRFDREWRNFTRFLWLREFKGSIDLVLGVTTAGTTAATFIGVDSCQNKRNYVVLSTTWAMTRAMTWTVTTSMSLRLLEKYWQNSLCMRVRVSLAVTLTIATTTTATSMSSLTSTSTEFVGMLVQCRRNHQWNQVVIISGRGRGSRWRRSTITGTRWRHWTQVSALWTTLVLSSWQDNGDNGIGIETTLTRASRLVWND